MGNIRSEVKDIQFTVLFSLRTFGTRVYLYLYYYVSIGRVKLCSICTNYFLYINNALHPFPLPLPVTQYYSVLFSYSVLLAEMTLLIPKDPSLYFMAILLMNKKQTTTHNK